ncbi:MAG: SpoIIE family protein phosphatase [Chloroflexi bacterium]|nr:SpoIIE family protein phosphatase [Chloroflexota bacterium]
MTDSHFSVEPEYLQLLYEVTRYLNSSLELGPVLDYVIDRAIEVTRAERGFLMLMDEQTGKLHFEVARGMNRQDLETPAFEVSTTVINQMMGTQEPILTSNALYDKRFMGGESVITKGLRSILCVPIMVRDQMTGLIYVDNRIMAGMFNEGHRDLLAAFASQAGIAIENARLYQVAVEKGRMQRELEMARNIQQGLLPRRVKTLAGYEVAFDWYAAREVAGDFYDCFLLDEHRMGVVVADVADKGAPAAIFMAVARSLLRGNAFSHQSPDETLISTNRLLIQDATGGIFVTIYYAIFDLDGGLYGVNAGHNLPLLYRANTQQTEWLPRGGRPLGWFDDLPTRIDEYQLTPGDVVVFYTDGLTEAENLYQEPFGDARLAEIVIQNADGTAAHIKNAILAAVTAFVGNAPVLDDLTLVVVRYLGEK